MRVGSSWLVLASALSVSFSVPDSAASCAITPGSDIQCDNDVLDFIGPIQLGSNSVSRIEGSVLTKLDVVGSQAGISFNNADNVSLTIAGSTYFYDELDPAQDAIQGNGSSDTTLIIDDSRVEAAGNRIVVEMSFGARDADVIIRNGSRVVSNGGDAMQIGTVDARTATGGQDMQITVDGSHVKAARLGILISARTGAHLGEPSSITISGGGSVSGETAGIISYFDGIDAVSVTSGARLQGGGVGLGAYAVDEAGQMIISVDEGTISGGRAPTALSDALALSGSIDLGQSAQFATVTVENGSLLDGRVRLSRQDDRLSVRDSRILGDVLLANGDDVAFFGTGSSVVGTIFDGGEGSDTITVSGDADISAIERIDGGNGTDGETDVLVFDGWTGPSAGNEVVGDRLANWDTIALQNASDVMFAGAGLATRQDSATDPVTSLRYGFVVDESSTARFADSFSIDGNVSNFGMLDLSTPNRAPDTALTIGGNHAGRSSLILDTTLDGDASPTDRLVVRGDTDGMTDVIFNVIGGDGAQTDTGILVVDVAETSSSDGVFILANPDAAVEGIGDILIAGAYGYRLTRGDDIGEDSSQDWFLKSRRLDDTPLYQPAVPVYEALPAAMGALNGLTSLQQRVGNQHATRLKSPASTIWARIKGAHNRVEPNISTADARHDLGHWQLSSGFDAALVDDGSGRLIAGLNVAYGTSDLNVTSTFGDGTINASGFALAGTLTWYGENGFFADAQVQHAWFDSDLSSDVLGHLGAGIDGTGMALSLEIGQRLNYSGTLTIVPQAQLIWSTIDFDSFIGPNGETVSMGAGEGLEGRLGVAVEHARSWVASGGKTGKASVYGIANLNYAFLSETTVNVSGMEFRLEPDAFSGELGIGGTYNWNDDKYALYGEASYSSSLSNPGDTFGLKGNLGFRMSW